MFSNGFYFTVVKSRDCVMGEEWVNCYKIISFFVIGLALASCDWASDMEGDLTALRCKLILLYTICLEYQDRHEKGYKLFVTNNCFPFHDVFHPYRDKSYHLRLI